MRSRQRSDGRSSSPSCEPEPAGCRNQDEAIMEGEDGDEEPGTPSLPVESQEAKEEHAGAKEEHSGMVAVDLDTTDDDFLGQ